MSKKETNKIASTNKVAKKIMKKETSTGEIKSKPVSKKKIKSKISIVVIIVLAIFILMIVIWLGYQFLNKGKHDIDYTDAMKSYGFEKLYNDNSADETSIVTKSELIKIVIAATLNTDDVSNQVELRSFISNYDGNENKNLSEMLTYKNQVWVEYANVMGMIENNTITIENEMKPATLSEALVILSKAKSILLARVLDTKEDITIKNMEALKVSEQLAIQDMVSNGIIEEKDQNFAKSLSKKELNALVIEFALKYNTITIGDEKININKDKIPSNANEYPYTLASVNKSIYEMPNDVLNKDNMKNAKNIYQEMKSCYYDINQLIEQYSKTVLNIDYQTIDADVFANDIQTLYLHREDPSDIAAYVDYVKANKIKITATAKAQYPAIYFDGVQYRVRVKIDYKIESANEKTNLWYMDLQSSETVSYHQTEQSIVVDLKIDKAITSEDTVYMVSAPITYCMTGAAKTFKRKENPVTVPNQPEQTTGENGRQNTVPIDTEMSVTF